jgi:hypothetical protein
VLVIPDKRTDVRAIRNPATGDFGQETEIVWHPTAYAYWLRPFLDPVLAGLLTGSTG